MVKSGQSGVCFWGHVHLRLDSKFPKALESAVSWLLWQQVPQSVTSLREAAVAVHTLRMPSFSIRLRSCYISIAEEQLQETKA